MKSVEEHRRGGVTDVRCGVVTVSTSRAVAASSAHVNDESGDLACDLIRGRGFRVTFRKLVADDVVAIRGALIDALSSGMADAVIFVGGTGVAPSDVTPEAIEPLIDRFLPGFGELFRSKSSAEIGSAAIMSRASAGLVEGVAVACLPGSPDGVRLGLGILLDELPHLLSIARSA